MSSIRAKHDLRGKFGPARDQQARPTCIAFAMSDVHAAVRGPWQPLSCEYLFYQAKRRDKRPPTKGTSLRAIRKAIEEDGQPIESEWPYLASLPADITAWKPPAAIGEVFRRTSNLAGANFDAAWASVAGGNPALIVMTISNAFYTPSKAGLVNATEPVDPHRRHAIVAAAAGELAGARYLMVRNSWSASWGLKGYAWVAETYMSARILNVVTLTEIA